MFENHHIKERLLKPTRNDLINVLRKRAIARISKELEAVSNSWVTLPVKQIGDEIHAETMAAAIAKFKALKKFAAIAKKLDEIGIPYTITATRLSVSQLSDNYRIDVSVIPGGKSPLVSINHTADQIKRRKKANEEEKALYERSNELQTQLNKLMYPSRNCDFFSDIISDLMIESDKELTRLASKIESRLDKLLNDAVATK